ncbi:hypothetical protein D1872_241430 [compost metagenome]
MMKSTIFLPIHTLSVMTRITLLRTVDLMIIPMILFKLFSDYNLKLGFLCPQQVMCYSLTSRINTDVSSNKKVIKYGRTPFQLNLIKLHRYPSTQTFMQ